MNFFSIEKVNNAIKNGSKPIMYYNIEMTSEEVEKRFLNTFHKKEKSILDDQKLVNTKYELNPNKEI